MTTAAMRKLNVLIVDDDPSMVRLLESLLRKQLGDSAQLHVSTDAAAARQWLEEHCCDILISDIEMPELGGIELLRAAKVRNAWTQVVFVTGHSSVDRLTDALEWGATDYLLKPIDPDAMYEVVEQMRRRCERWHAAVVGTFAAMS